MTGRQITFLDQDLTAAEGRKLTHAFLFFHGPVYAVSGHTSCAVRSCATTPTVIQLIAVLNRHPIVSAIFNGHEHLQAYVHMDNTRVPEITHPFEEFITGSAGAALHNCAKTYRYDACDSVPGFATILVDGPRFTVTQYMQGESAPIRMYLFTKTSLAPTP
jgi:hypothetical protein